MSSVVPLMDAENEPPQQQQARLKAVKKRRKSVAAPSRAEPFRAALPVEDLYGEAVESDAAVKEPGTPKAAAAPENVQRTPNTQREQRLRAKYEKACDARDKLKFQVCPLMLHVWGSHRALTPLCPKLARSLRSSRRTTRS